MPYGPNGETLVTFYNRIKQGMVKVCKQIPMTSQDSLGRQGVQVRGLLRQRLGQPGHVVTLGPIKPGECTSFSDPFNVLLPNGKWRAVGVAEVPVSGVVQLRRHEHHAAGHAWSLPELIGSLDPNIDTTVCDLYNTAAGNPDLVHGWINFYLAPGTNVVTYTNKSKDP